MYDLAGENELDLEPLRARLRRMSERELLRFRAGYALHVLARGQFRQKAAPGVRNPIKRSAERMASPQAGLLAIRFSSRKYDCGGQAGGNGVSSRVPPTQCICPDASWLRWAGQTNGVAIATGGQRYRGFGVLPMVDELIYQLFEPKKDPLAFLFQTLTNVSWSGS